MYPTIPGSPTPPRQRGVRRADFQIAMAVLALFLSACGGGGSGSSSSTPPPPSAPPTYQLTRLVSDQVSAGATTTDSHLVNPWGLAYGPTTTFWVANQGTATSTVYDGLGRMPSTPIVVTNPMVQGHAMGGPTGMVYSDSSGFRGDKFIVATLDGCICGWSAGATMDRRLDNSDSPAVYTGLAIGTSGTGTYLFAANFTAGTVDVFDSNYSPVSLGNTALVDPTLPAGFSPFNVQVLGGRLYVTYAKHDSPSLRETPGPGFGHVSVFNLEGRFVQRIASGGLLNAPWGLVLAPASFGPFGSALLVGNFGDGHITAFDATTGALRGQLAGPDTTPMVVSGLWGMAFGNGSSAGLINQLYVTAGPQGETHGMYGTISYGAPGGSGGGGGYGDGGY